MKHESDRPEPGEHRHEHQLRGETVDYPSAPDALPTPGVIDRRRTMDLPKVNLVDLTVDRAQAPDVTRRTGTERDGLRPVQVGGETEDRLDRTAHDLQRETRVDPAQDNAGPQSDKN